MELFRKLNDEGMTIVQVTHSEKNASYGKRIIQLRDGWVVPKQLNFLTRMFDSFFQDIRVGLRLLFKDKTFCFLAVLVLGLGIGGATTQFTVVNANRAARSFLSRIPSS